MLAKEARLESPELREATHLADEEMEAPDETPYRVAIYSLDEAATRRAVEILKSLHPHWVIHANADQVCTDRLKALAHTANVFVFAWRCSKHAAYYCVKASSQKENLVMARGVGTTSLVAAAVEFLRGNPA
jgi:S-adenosylhomocysteine hydrolase